MTRLSRPRQLVLAPLLLLLLAACGSKQDRIESGLKKGAEFVRLADWDKASVEVRNVLQIDPKSARAYHLAARVSEAQREPQRAHSQYLKALELEPQLLEAKTGLARLYLLNNELERAETSVNEILAAAPRHADARTLRAALLARRGQTDAAMALAREVLVEAGAKASADTSLLLAGLHANLRQWDQALAVLDAALQADPRHLGLLQAAAEVTASDPANAALAARADGYFRRATAETPKSQVLWLAWARHHLARKDPDRAEAVLRDAIKAQPEDGKRTQALLDFLATHRGFEVAEKQYLASIQDKPRDMTLRQGLANLYRSAQRPAQAQQALSEIIDRSEDASSSVTARTQLAAYRLAAGRADEARALLAEVLKTNPRDNAALVLRSRLHLQDNQPADAVIDLRAALRDQPGSVEIVQLLAQAHRAAAEPQLAREVLAEAVKFRPQDPQLRAMLAADMADARDYRAAMAELDTGLKATPQAPQLHEMKAQIALAQKDFAGAQKALETFKAQQPRQATAYLRLGQLHTSQKRYDAALKEYDAGTAAAAGDMRPYMAAVSLLTGLQRHDEAKARIQAAQKQDPANAQLHQQLSGELALMRRDFAEAERAFRAAMAAAPAAAAGHLGLARTLAARGDADASLAALAAGEKAVPTDRALPLARAEALTRARRWDEAIALYDSLRSRFPDDDAVVNNLAYLLAEVKGDKASTERALGLASRFAASRNPGYLDSLGWIHYQLGQYDKAVPLLEKAATLAPPSPLLQLHLGKALVKNGDAARGKALIQRAIDSKANLPRLDEARALLAQS